MGAQVRQEAVTFGATFPNGVQEKESVGKLGQDLIFAISEDGSQGVASTCPEPAGLRSCGLWCQCQIVTSALVPAKILTIFFKIKLSFV